MSVFSDISYSSPSFLSLAAGILFSQKRVAIYKSYKRDTSFLRHLFNVEQVAFGLFSQSEEVLRGIPLLAPVTIITANPSQTSRLTKNPVESGATISDHKVFESATCSISFAFPYLYYDNVSKELEEYFRESTELVILTPYRPYYNMVITSLSPPCTDREFSRIQMNVTFEEAIRVNSVQNGNLDSISNASDASTQRVGSVNLY